MQNPKVILEICAADLRSAINAQIGGADRIELCDNLTAGGTTPSYGIIKLVRHLLSIDINVLIRPRAGNFIYDDNEFEIMKSDISMCRDLGADGIVIGILKESGDIDFNRVLKLIEIARPMSVTFHRAIDLTVDILGNVLKMMEIGVDRILTSGGRNTVYEGRNIIKKMTEIAGEDIIIMPGGGLDLERMEEFIKFTGAKELHFSAKKLLTDNSKYFNDQMDINKLQGEQYSSDPEIIKNMVSKLKI